MLKHQQKAPDVQHVAAYCKTSGRSTWAVYTSSFKYNFGLTLYSKKLQKLANIITFMPS